jgi:GxxExxY protein
MTQEKRLLEEQLTSSVIGAYYNVYNTLGYGFLEHLYGLALERELQTKGHRVAREVLVQVKYKNHDLGFQRVDMVVDERLIVEIKSTEQLHPAAGRQLYNYLKATGVQVGLLLHFGLKPAFYRFVCSH